MEIIFASSCFWCWIRRLWCSLPHPPSPSSYEPDAFLIMWQLIVAFLENHKKFAECDVLEFLSFICSLWSWDYVQRVEYEMESISPLKEIELDGNLLDRIFENVANLPYNLELEKETVMIQWARLVNNATSIGTIFLQNRILNWFCDVVELLISEANNVWKLSRDALDQLNEGICIKLFNSQQNRFDKYCTIDLTMDQSMRDESAQPKSSSTSNSHSNITKNNQPQAKETIMIDLVGETVDLVSEVQIELVEAQNASPKSTEDIPQEKVEPTSKPQVENRDQERASQPKEHMLEDVFDSLVEEQKKLQERSRSSTRDIPTESIRIRKRTSCKFLPVLPTFERFLVTVLRWTIEDLLKQTSIHLYAVRFRPSILTFFFSLSPSPPISLCFTLSFTYLYLLVLHYFLTITPPFAKINTFLYMHI